MARAIFGQMALLRKNNTWVKQVSADLPGLLPDPPTEFGCCDQYKCAKYHPGQVTKLLFFSFCHPHIVLHRVVRVDAATPTASILVQALSK